MSFLGKLGEKIGDKISESVVAKIAAVIGGGVLVMLGAAWLWTWSHVNPQFNYTARPSSLSSHFVSLSQILSQIENDSHLYCTGGWDQRIGRLGLRKCYHFTFAPVAVYKMTICTHAERIAQVSTSDQLVALRYFEQRFAPLQCFQSVERGGENDYQIALGKDSRFRIMQFLNEAPEDVAFCGCSRDEEQEIATALGAVLR